MSTFDMLELPEDDGQPRSRMQKKNKPPENAQPLDASSMIDLDARSPFEVPEIVSSFRSDNRRSYADDA